MKTPKEIIEQLNLTPHPEGGWFKRTYTASPTLDYQGHKRPIASAIYFLIAGDIKHRWHRVDADELWHFYEGSSLIVESRETVKDPPHQSLLGLDFTKGERPQRLINAGLWQRSRLLEPDADNWALVGCSVAPAFSFSGFEMVDD